MVFQMIRFPFFSRLNSVPFCVYTTFFIHLFIDTHLSSCLALVNSVTINTGVQISLWYNNFTSFGYILCSRMAGSFNSSIFNFERTLHIVVFNVCTDFQLHQHLSFRLFVNGHSTRPYVR